jgi:hypothetical protein
MVLNLVLPKCQLEFLMKSVLDWGMLANAFLGARRFFLLRLLALFLVLTVALVWPMQAPVRDLLPADWGTVAVGHTDAMVQTGTVLGVRVAMAPPLEFGGRRMGLREVIELAESSALNGFVKNYPQLFPARIRIPGRGSGGCLSVLRVGGQESAPAQCDSRRQPLEFVFVRPLKPGVWAAELVVLEGELSVTLAQDRSGQRWLPVQSANRPRGYVVVAELVRKSPWRVGLFSLAIGALMLCAGWRRLSIVVAAVALPAIVGLGVVALARPLSGHDETAHITMAYHAGQQVLGTEFKAPEEREFFRAVTRLSVESDFFRLHSVLPVKDGACPHEIVGGCGETERPTWLYKNYFKALPFAKDVTWNPIRLLCFGIGINLIFLALFLFGIAWLFRRDTVALLGLAVPLVLCGAFWGQLSSLTNDIPQYLFGFSALAACLAVVRAVPRRKIALWLVLLHGFSFLGSCVDRSWVTGLPALALADFGFLLVVLKGACEHEPRVHWVWLVFAGCVGAAGAFLLWFVKVAFGLLPDLAARLQATLSETALVVAAPVLDLKSQLLIFKWHLDSFFGSFIWGHSYYNSTLYTLFFLVFAALVFVGLSALAGRLPGRGSGESAVRAPEVVAGVYVVGGVALLAVQFFVVQVVAGAQFGLEPIAAMSYTKIRLSAPGLASLCFFPVVGVVALFERFPVARRLSVFALCAWGIWFLAYYQLRFNYGDAY